MTEREETKVVRTWLQCDGCGYTIGKDTDHMILTVKRKREESFDLHFHMPAQPGENRSWGSRDCLGYWHTNRAAREFSTRSDGLHD